MKKKLSKLLLISLLIVSVAAPASASASNVKITPKNCGLGHFCSLIK